MPDFANRNAQSYLVRMSIALLIRLGGHCLSWHGGYTYIWLENGCHWGNVDEIVNKIQLATTKLMDSYAFGVCINANANRIHGSRF